MKKLTLLLAAVLSMSGIFATTANALRFVIETGDQPYYLYGPGYWRGGVHYCWIHGHWNRFHTVWIHGHYRPC